ncbi:MAG: hypothetical protein HYT75_03955 [Deltaproteobacteria bacterium]|nr:hypothetical protein [Deltaproteobacteria bacterium]MBI2342557.1 hypothetical protein [Deltaproteobacteria bacterium]
MADFTPLSSKAVDIMCRAPIFCDRFDVAVDMDIDGSIHLFPMKCHGTDWFGDVKPTVLSFTVMPDKSIYVKNENGKIFSVSQFGVLHDAERPSFASSCFVDIKNAITKCSHEVGIDKTFYECYLTSSNPSLTVNQKEAAGTFFRSILAAFPEIVVISK